MKIGREEINEIKQKMEEYRWEPFEHIGLRVQNEPFVEGETLDNSRRWIDGEMTDEELDGTSALSIMDVGLSNVYFGVHLAIIGGDSAEWGEDVGELVIRDAVVLEVLR